MTKSKSSEIPKPQPIESIKIPEIEKLSKELFFHSVNPESYAKNLAIKMVDGMSLFGIAGRATVKRGFPDTYGPCLVFRIPESEQSQLLTTDLDPSTDTGLSNGNDEIFALTQKFNSTLIEKQKQTIIEWLESSRFLATIGSIAQRPLNQTLPLIRRLDPKYFCGLFHIEEDKGQRDIRKKEKLIYPFVQNVRCIIPNSSNPLGCEALEKGINYFIRYNPLNKASWR